MAKRLQLRRGTTAQHSTFTGAEGEVTVDTDKDTIILHDGTTVGGIEMARNSSIDSLTTTPINTAIDNANFDIVGGGTITVNATGNVLWNSPFVLRGNGYGSHFSTDGYFNIQCPTSGTIIGVGGAANTTATSNGILLNANESLYFIIPIGSNGATGSNSTMFRIVGNTSALVIPSNWIKIATRYNSSYVEFINGTSLRLNTSLNTDSYDILGSDVSGAVSSANQLTTARTINGVLFNGTANINIEDRLGTAIASATTTTIGTAGLGDYIHITGTTTITSFGTASAAGVRRTLIFDGNLTITNNATSLICTGGVDIVTTAGMVIEVVAESTTNWRVVSITHPSVSTSELGYLTGLTSNIQTQLDNKAAINANTTGSSGSCTGNAATATKLATARTINGVSFDGTADITVVDSTKAPLESPALTGTPTAPTPTAGDNSTKVATTAFVKAKSEAVSIGVNQTWQDVTASRSAGVTYTNTTGKPIYLSVLANTTSAPGAIRLTINGIKYLDGNSVDRTGYPVGVCCLIPNASTYEVYLASSSIDKWAELR